MQPLTHATKHQTTIDASALRPRDRFAFWNDVVCTHFSPSVNSTDEPADRFTARMSYRSLGAISLSQIHSAPTLSRRDRQSLRERPLDCFFVSLLDEGQAVVRQGGREAVQRAGDFVMYDSAAPFEYFNHTEFSGSWIRLPRQIVANRMIQPDAMTARVVSGRDSIGRVVANVVREAHGLDLSGDTPAANRMATSIVDLLSAAFETQAGVDQVDNMRHMAMLDRAKSHILANLEDPDLDIDSLVSRLGVSRRTLNRIFVQEGTTPIRWLWKQRLERAQEMLLSGHEDRVADVAVACGFSNFSHFTRSFKNEYGVTPKSMLMH